jgi:hypothetical protein
MALVPAVPPPTSPLPQAKKSPAKHASAMAELRIGKRRIVKPTLDPRLSLLIASVLRLLIS